MIRSCLILSIHFASCLCNNPWAQQLPAPTGSFGVGRKTFVWTDSSRNDPWAAPAVEKRKLMIQLWYPTDEVPSEKAKYFPGGDKLKGNYSASQRKAVQSITTHALSPASLSKTKSPYPVLIFSPGADLPTYFYTSLLEDLASHGYVIAAIDHSYEGVGQVFPDGSVVRPSEKFRPTPGPNFLKEAEDYYKLKVNIRSDDASFVLDKITFLNANEKDFSGKMDLQRVAIFGHSLGGVAAGQATIKDKRFKAAINYDGLSNSLPFFPDSSGRTIEGPFMFVMKPFRPFDEKQLKRANMTPKQDSFRIRYALAKGDSCLRSIKNTSYRLTIFAAQHESFSDVPFFSDENVAAKKQTLQLIEKYTLEFFNRFLKAEKGELIATSTENEELKLEIYNN